ncbi:MAG: DMT family transporter [Spirochaetales bacterium]|nr:DMT family transporter [Spirochaetales bacterium]
MRIGLLANDALLLTTSLIWGLAFVAQRVGMEHIGPFTFNGIRFFLGAAALLPVALVRSRMRFTALRPTIRDGALAGLVLFVASSLQQFGLVRTTAGNAGFITGLYVVLVPFIGLLWGQRIGVLRWVAVAFGVAGLYLLTVRDGMRVNSGDLYVLGSAFFFALHVHAIARLSKRHSALWLSLTQYVCVGAMSLAVGLVAESVPPGALRAAAIPILYGGLASIAVAYTLQVIAQRRAHPSHAAILLSLEGTFAALGGWLILDEVLSARALVGCALLFTGMLTSQLSGLRNAAQTAG